MPVDGATVELIPAYASAKSRFVGTKLRDGVYGVDLPREHVDSPLRLVVTSAGQKIYDKVSFWGQKGRADVVFAGTVVPKPVTPVPPAARAPSRVTVEVTIRPESADVGEPVSVTWVITGGAGGRKMCHRLILPDGSVHIPRTGPDTAWLPAASGRATYEDLVRDGGYTFQLEFAPSADGGRMIEKKFMLTWTTPRPLVGGDGVDFAAAFTNAIGTSRDSILAAGFRTARGKWTAIADERLAALKITEPAEQLAQELEAGVNREQLGSTLSTAAESGEPVSLEAYARVFDPSIIHDLVLNGNLGLVRAYRDAEANRALTMAAITGAGIGVFAGRAASSPEAELEHQIAETKAAISPPSPAVPPRGEVNTQESPVREAVAPSAELVTTEGISTDSEEEGFGKEGVQLYTGFSAFGPELGVGFTAGTLSIEAHGVYHLINWDKAQDIWNKTVPGGFLASLQVFPMAAGSFLPWRLKPFLGGEFGRVNEGNGKTYKAISGEPTKGYWQWADAQIGIRAYVTSRISITAWGGYVLWKTDKHSMLAQYAKVGYRDNFSRVLGNVTIGYTW